MSEPTFTGERLHTGDARFALDLARHEAAYQLARSHAGTGRVLELGSGSGYGAAALVAADVPVVALDRVAPDAAGRASGCHFLRGDVNRPPVAPRSFGLVVSFQVIEHLEDPTAYVDAIADAVAENGTALLTTPNRLMSDGVNPYHVHEYVADELARCLDRRFASVELLGIGASPAVRQHLEERSRRIQRIVRLDPLGLRDRLPSALIERLFALFALLVRRGSAGDAQLAGVSWRDFPVGPAADDCLDLLAVCRKPR